MRYVTLQRVARAKELLAGGDLPVPEVGRASGFGDASHFIRTFREATGETPLRFRKRATAGASAEPSGGPGGAAGADLNR
jgi:transcriptional regulator GlxA family with amidase domain